MTTTQERLTAQEFRAIEHALQVLVSLTSHARSSEVAHKFLIGEGDSAIETLQRLLGYVQLSK